MTNIKELGKKLVDEAKNLVLDTKGGEMPDPDHKPEETASDAAKVFENKKQNVKDLKDKVRDQLVVDEDGDQRDNDTEIDPELEKKVS